MAAEPSLGELASAGQSMTPVADTAVTSQTELVRNLTQAAQFKAENDWRKYNDFQKRLGDFYQNQHDVEKLDVMDEDKEDLQKDAAKLYEQIANNPGAFSGRNPQAWAEVNKTYGNLLSRATQSKQDNLFDKANRKYVVDNNELNTDENKSIIEGYKKAPLGSRQAYTLSLQPVFDANSYAETLKGQVEKQYSPEQQTTMVGFDQATGKPIPGQGYLRETTTSKIPFQDYIGKWNASLNMQTDKNNQPIKGWAKKQYDTLPADRKDPKSDSYVPFEKFWEDIGTNLYGSTKDDKGKVKDIIKTTKDEVKADPNYLKDKTLAQQDKSLDETRRHNKAMEGLGWERIKSGNEEDDSQAQGAIIEIGDVVANATRPENLKFVIDTKGNRQQLGTVSDPDLIKKYTTLDKDGKSTNPPDDVLIDRTSGQMSLIYYKKNDEGEIQKSPQGAEIIQKSLPVNTSTWVSAVVGRNEGTKNKGKVINTVQKFYDKLGGVYQGARKLNESQNKQDAANNSQQPEKGILDYAPNIQKGIKAFMDANPNIKTEAEAIKLLRENKKID